MSSIFKGRSDLAFNIIHNALQGQSIDLLAAVNLWTLPAGIIYENRVDRFTTTTSPRVVVEPNLDTWDIPSMTVPVVPNRRRKTLTVQGPMLSSVETFDVVYMKWDSSLMAFIDAGLWRARIGSALYRIKNVDTVPILVAEPSLIQLYLES